MRAWSIGILAGGLLAYGVTEAELQSQTPSSRGAATTVSARAPGNVTQTRVLAEAGRGSNWSVAIFPSSDFTALVDTDFRLIRRQGPSAPCSSLQTKRTTFPGWFDTYWLAHTSIEAPDHSFRSNTVSMEVG